MKAVSILKYVFSIIGFSLLGLAAYFFVSTQNFIDNAVSTNGIVIKLIESYSSDSTTYKPVVRYTPKGGESINFTSSSSSNPPSYHVNEEVTVLYNPENPMDAKIDGYFSLWGAFIIVGGIGTVFTLIGLSFFLFPFLQARKKQDLLQSGRLISADYLSVNLNTSYKVNGRSPYYISAQWQNPLTTDIHQFKSENIWFDPSQYINTKVIHVYLDKQNPKRYYMDVSFLPEPA